MLVFLSFVFLVACSSLSTNTERAFLTMTLGSNSNVAVAEATLRFDPSSLSFMGAGSRDGLTLVAAFINTNTMRLNAVSTSAKPGELAVVVFEVKSSNHTQPTWISTQGYDTDGSQVLLGVQTQPDYSSVNPIAGYAANKVAGSVLQPRAIPVTGLPIATWGNSRLGDVDKSGAITSSDTTLVTNISGGTTATDEQKYLADIDGNGVVNAFDINACQQLVTNTTTLDAQISVAPETISLTGAGTTIVLVGNAGRVALPTITISNSPGVTVSLTSTSTVGTRVYTVSATQPVTNGVVTFAAGNAGSQGVQIGATPGGTLDATFNSVGKQTTDVGSNFDYALAMAINSSGKIALAGRTFNGTNDDFAVTQYTTTGILDTTFDTDGKLTTPVGTSDDVAQSAAFQTDGKLVVGGWTFNGTSDDFALVRYNTNGSLDTTFGSSGKIVTDFGANDVLTAIKIQSDGKIVATGYTCSSATISDFALARYTTSGILDTTFDTDGKVTTPIGTGSDEGEALVIQSDGKLVVAGYSDNGTDTDFALARYTTAGGLDTTFDTDGKLTTPISVGADEAYGITIQSDGKIVVAGLANMTGTDYDFALVRYTTTGGLDTTFDTDGKATQGFNALSNDFARSVAIQSDGKIVVGGYLDNGVTDVALARFTTTGALDTTFDGDGLFTTSLSPSNDAAFALSLQSDGKILAAGYSRVGVNDDFAMIRVYK